MPVNPYEPPLVETPDEPDKAAIDFAERNHQFASILILLGLISIGPVVGGAVDYYLRRTNESAMLTGGGIVFAAMLVGWGWLQLRMNPVAITVSGIVAGSGMLFYLVTALRQLIADPSRPAVVAWSLGFLLVAYLLTGPMTLAAEWWAWRWRGIDVGQWSKQATVRLFAEQMEQVKELEQQLRARKQP